MSIIILAILGRDMAAMEIMMMSLGNEFTISIIREITQSIGKLTLLLKYLM